MVGLIMVPLSMMAVMEATKSGGDEDEKQKRPNCVGDGG
jgi:hypothetical protein